MCKYESQLAPTPSNAENSPDTVQKKPYQEGYILFTVPVNQTMADNLAFQNMPNINSIALGSPVLELKSFVWDNPCVRDDLKALCNMDQWDDRKVAGCNPYRNIVTINGKNYCFKRLPPLKIWYGGTESAKQYAIDLVEAIVNAGGYAEYRDVSGAGHEICYGMNDACNTDYLLFTQRYNGE